MSKNHRLPLICIGVFALYAILGFCGLLLSGENASAQSPPCDIGCTQLDPASRYMVVVRPLPGYSLPDDWRVKLDIESQIRDCFQGAGFERGDVGILFLDGIEIEIIQVIGEPR